MAIVVFMRQTRQAGLTGFFNDDPISAVEDGQDVGSQVDPDQNPVSIYQLVDVPGSPVSNISQTLVPAYGPEAGPPGQEHRPLIRKRAFTMQVNQLPILLRPAYNQGDRISLAEAEYLAAVNVKPGMP